MMPPGAEGLGGLDRFEAWFLSFADQALTGPLVAGAFAVAFVAGVFHALGPGHGKTIMVAYLAGTDGRLKAAASVGVIVATMHTLSAVALGGILYALVGSAGQLIGVAVPVMAVTSGALVMGVGAVLTRHHVRARRRRRERIAAHAGAGAGHAHGHAHGHGPGDDHHHALPEGASPASPRGLATIGMAGGLLPSPASFLVLTTAVFSGRALLGFALVLTFGLGLAATLTGVGALTVHGRRMLVDRSSRAPRAAWLTQHLPLVSSLALMAAGLWVMVFSLARF